MAYSRTMLRVAYPRSTPTHCTSDARPVHRIARTIRDVSAAHRTACRRGAHMWTVTSPVLIARCAMSVPGIVDRARYAISNQDIAQHARDTLCQDRT
eukprot:1849505-Rhodomonas_salina.2